MVEFLFWRECPSHEQALADLVATMDEFGLGRDQLTITEVRDDDQAERSEFVGSPTIRIDGVDIADTKEEPIGLNCRVYLREDGRVSPRPSLDTLRRAISDHVKQRTGSD